MKDKFFLNTYLEDFSNLVKPKENIINQLLSVKDLLKKQREKIKKF